MAGHATGEIFAGVRLTNPHKVMFAAGQVTKADLAAHYERVAARIMPHVGRRLLSLVRCPEGEDGPGFFQKHATKGFPREIGTMQITECDGGTDSYLHADSLAALVAAVQIGTVEFHIWGSRIDDIERPDRLVFDLDPDESIGFSDVRQAAFDIRDRLAALGMASLPLLTGGEGVHVVAPLQPTAAWPQVKAFARGFARHLERDDPRRYVASLSKVRRKGRVFVDYLRNERGSTAICPYSTRRRNGAPVATPLSWAELETVETANAFHIGDMEARLGRADPWAEADGWRQALTAAMIARYPDQ